MKSLHEIRNVDTEILVRIGNIRREFTICDNEKNCLFFNLIFFMKHHLTKLISRDLMFRTVLCSHKREMKGEKQLY